MPEVTTFVDAYHVSMRLSIWRSHDIARPLHGHWHLEGADEWLHEALPLDAHGAERHGWKDAGAFSVVPVDGRVLIRADATASGRLTLAVQGPVGSRMSVDDQSVEVEAAVRGGRAAGARGAAAVAVPAVAMTSRLILEREASAAMLVARAAVMVTGEGALSRCSRKRPSLQY